MNKQPVAIEKAYQPPPSPMAMSGWKTKTGAVLVAIGGTVSGSAKLAPYAEMGPWLEFLGFIIAGVGGALTVWGIGHKLEKNNTSVTINAVNRPPVNPPMRAGLQQ